VGLSSGVSGVWLSEKQCSAGRGTGEIGTPVRCVRGGWPFIPKSGTDRHKLASTGVGRRAASRLPCPNLGIAVPGLAGMAFLAKPPKPPLSQPLSPIPIARISIFAQSGRLMTFACWQPATCGPRDGRPRCDPMRRRRRALDWTALYVKQRALLVRPPLPPPISGHCCCCGARPLT
jgi:hypothetical protein